MLIFRVVGQRSTPLVGYSFSRTCRCRKLNPVVVRTESGHAGPDVGSHQTDLRLVLDLFRSRATLEAEILVLRQQIIVLRGGGVRRLPFSPATDWFWAGPAGCF